MSSDRALLLVIFALFVLTPITFVVMMAGIKANIGSGMLVVAVVIAVIVYLIKESARRYHGGMSGRLYHRRRRIDYYCHRPVDQSGAGGSTIMHNKYPNWKKGWLFLILLILILFILALLAPRPLSGNSVVNCATPVPTFDKWQGRAYVPLMQGGSGTCVTTTPPLPTVGFPTDTPQPEPTWTPRGTVPSP